MRTIVLLMAVSITASLAAQAADSGLKTLPHHVPAAVSHLKAIGSVADTNILDLAIGLTARNQQAMDDLVKQVSDPSSPDYRHFLSPEQFTEQFGPTKQDYQAAIDYIKANRMTVIGTHPNRMVLDVRGTAGDIQRAFHVSLQTYHHPTEARDFFAPNVDPSVPAGLQIQDISGLDSFRRPHPKYKLKSAGQAVKLDQLLAAKAAAQSAANPAFGSGPSGNYIGDDFRKAYVPGTSLNGSNQSIALVQFDGYLASDIAEYETLAGRTNVPLQNILIDGFTGTPTGSGGEVEVSLDIEMVVSMAPALANVYLYEGDPFNFHPNDVLNRIASDNLARQISCSWGWTGGPTVTTDQIFKQMALQGQTFFTASGDGDAYPAGTVDSPSGFGTPSDSVYVTSVGGTTLTMNGTGNSYNSETVWNWGVEFGPAFDGVGSSGAISTYYTIPYWQTNVNMSANGGSTTQRNMPDVALTADNVLVIADGGIEYTGTGGTSCASPLWAGFTSLVNQQRTNSSLASLGFINPALYSIAAGSSYTNCFHDISTGNNEWSGSPNLFVATANYDLCTGLGSPNGTNLINALSQANVVNPITHISPPPKPYGSTLSALNGSNPNGTWSLFVMDDTPLNVGIISNGWTLTLVTGNTVGYTGDNAVTVAASTTNASIGSAFSYFITVTNYGPSTSTNVIVSDVLPNGVTLLSSNLTIGTLIQNGSTRGWNVGTLSNGMGGSLTLTVSAGSSGTYIDSAIVNASTPDANPDDDSAMASVVVGTPTPPSFSSAAVVSGHKFQVNIASLGNQTNVVQASTNLSNPNGWVPIYTNVGPFTFQDPNSTNYQTRFYRDVITGP